MRFFSELVACYWDSSAAASGVSSKAEQPSTEETTSLVAVEGQKKRRRKQGYVSASDKLEWKPSLGAISEEKMVVVVVDNDRENEDRTVRSGVLAKLRGGSRSTRPGDVCFGGDAVPLVIPAFSPTPFLF